MVKVLVGLLRMAATSNAVEGAGAVCIVVAVGLLASWPWALLAAGVMLVLVAAKLDVGGGE